MGSNYSRKSQSEEEEDVRYTREECEKCLTILPKVIKKFLEQHSEKRWQYFAIGFFDSKEDVDSVPKDLINDMLFALRLLCFYAVD